MSTSQAPVVQPGVGAQHPKGAVEQPLHGPTLERPLIDPRVKEAIKNGVGMITKNAVVMTKMFEEIAQLLQRANQTQLLNDWLDLQKTSRQLLRDSKDLTLKVALSAEQFENVTLLTAKGGEKEAIPAIKEFQANCEQIVQESEAQCKRALDERRNVAQFLEKLEQWNNDNLITRQLRRKILDIVHRESTLRKMVDRLCYKVGFHYIITNSSSSMPEVVSRAVDVANLPSTIKQQMKVFQDDFQHLQQELNRFQEELHKAEDDLSNSDLSKAYFRVRRIEDEQEIKFIMSLLAVGVVPEGEVHDCMDIVKWLENPTHLPRPMILKAYQENPKTIYGAISEAAQKYAAEVQSE